ncbi:hypothetical protein HNR65_001783 [Desulfosalsimonas propionicica]|uniref:Uncharacterized protein n=1 Tax=Desulfosalsimonas propionicica TaxID=332175 RepID=A0A7W0C949_9BACT|nr:hypothetical protein [Desulfosalsimonas propionicica]MBA2881456.1 hypothetical protein [Desulfosalsimonas propionicica]
MKKFSSLQRLCPGSYVSAGAALVCLVILFWAGCATVRHFLAEAACATRVNATLRRNVQPPIRNIQGAIFLDPANGAYHAKLSQSVMMELINLKTQGPGSGDNAAEHKKIRLGWQKALLSNPVNAQYWYQYGMFVTWEKKWSYQKRLQQADHAMAAAYDLKPYGPGLLYSLGGYWLWRSKIPGSIPGAREKGLGLLRKAVLLDRGFLHRAAELLWYHDPSPEAVSELAAEGDPGIKKALQRWLKIKKKGGSK